VNTSAAWTWAAWGKHPVVKDYIRFGPETLSAGALYRWVEEGYSKVPVNTNLHSWRFFARGTQPRELVCGLLRDSFDGAGRPFPFLIVGTGRLEGWEKHWVHLPEIVGGLWERLEFLSTRRVFDLEELKGDVGRLPSPVFKKQWQPLEVPEGDGALFDAHEGMFSMGLNGTGDHLSEIVQGLNTLKTQDLPTPDAVFIGGLLEQSYLVAFTRLLNDSDFLRLWTMGNK